MDRLAHPASTVAQEVYTDLHSVNSLKTEKNADVALRKVAQEFESIFINIMLKSMRDANAVFEEGNFLHSSEADTYRDMYDQQLALSLAKGKGLGIADVLYRQLQGQYGGQMAAATSTGEPDAAATFALPTRRVQHGQTSLAADTSAVSASAAPASAEASPEAPPKFAGSGDFIEHLLPMAEKAAGVIGVHPLMMLAQAALETGWGKHLIKAGRDFSYNLFNIKADASWQGDAVTKTTLEYQDGVAVKEAARFRKYASFSDSMQDFVEFLQRNPRYDNALQYAAEPERFIEELQRAGYATDPHYSNKVIGVFEQLKRTAAASE